MDLIKIQEMFNEHYEFEKLKKYILNSARNLINDWENNYLSEYKDELEDDLTFKDLEIEYVSTQLIINNSSRISPYFRVCIDLNHPTTKFALYKYEIEYNIDGEICDDYFYNV